MNAKRTLYYLMIVMVFLYGCNLPDTATEIPAPTASPLPPPTEVPQQTILHTVFPISESAPDANAYPDVTSADTAPEQRAPYGDSFDLNRLERPFTQDMVYLPDVDIASFSLSEDAEWYYLSIEMVGKNPNSPENIQFSVELDTNLDSFGDYLIVAQPPYSETWSADTLKIYADTDRDSAGVNAAKSDAPFSGNGYDQLIHSVSEKVGSDVDVAWVRVNAGPLATVQFAFKNSFSGSSFLYSVMADAGLQDVSHLDYVDFMNELEAGSPVRSNSNYPLKKLFAVDNTCYQAFGFKASGYEPKICPVIVQPQIVQPEISQPGIISTIIPGVTPSNNNDKCTSVGSPNPGNCPYGWADYPYCYCIPG